MTKKGAGSPHILKRRHRVLVTLLGAIGQLLLHSLRVRLHHEERYLRCRDAGQPVIFAVWHAQLLLVVRQAQCYGVTTLASPSLDGEIGARVGERLGVPAIRGDERHAPVAALRRLTGVLQRGGNLGLFPDGPLGPAGQVKPGVLMLAQRSGCAVIPVGGEARWCLRLNSGWDSFLIPLPFSSVSLWAGEPVFVPPDATPAERAALAELIAQQMEALSLDARRAVRK